MTSATDSHVVWQGVFRSFQETGCDVARLDDHPAWLKKCEVSARAELECLFTGKVSPGLFQPRNMLLPVVVSLLVSSEEPKILDFGGGLGTSYFILRSMKAADARVQVDVIETSAMCELAGKILPVLPGLRFLAHLPANNEQYDLIHAASSLHYVDDWRGLLGKFAALRAKYLVLTELTAGPIETFVTTQSYYGHDIPVRFWSLHEFSDALRGLGFRPILMMPHLPTIRGVRMGPPMDNFPRELRLDHFLDLVFVRDRTSAEPI